MKTLQILPVLRGAVLLAFVAGCLALTSCRTTERVVDGTERVGRKTVHGAGHVVHKVGDGVGHVGRKMEGAVD